MVSTMEDRFTIVLASTRLYLEAVECVSFDGMRCTFRMDMACDMALGAVGTITVEKPGGQREIDIKRYARVEKIPGGTIEDSEVLQGVMIQKDVTHARMRR